MKAFNMTREYDEYIHNFLSGKVAEESIRKEYISQQ